MTYPTWSDGDEVESIHSFTAYNVREGDRGVVVATACGGAVRVFIRRIEATRWFSADQLRRPTKKADR